MGTIQSTKIGCGFKSASERPGCRDCKHGQQEYTDRMPPYDKAGWKCKRYGFFVTAMAICDTHEPKTVKAGGA